MKKQRCLRGIVAGILSLSLLLGNTAVFAEEWAFSDRIAALREMDSVWVDYARTQIDRDLNAPEAYTEANSALPEKYDLRVEGLSTAVKDQSPLSDCYAFGAIGSVESNYLKQTGKTGNTPSFSEKHLAYFAQHTRPDNLNQAGEGIVSLKDDGTVDETGVGLEWGMPTLSIGQLSNGEGVVSTGLVPHTADDGTMESTKLWTVSEDYRNLSEARVTQAEILSTPANYSSGSYQYDAQATQNIKKHLVDNGALCISMGVYDAKSAEDAKSVWNEATGAYYSKPETRSNHAVTLIGWDDTFSKTNFSVGNQPAGDGAWLIKNSWGNTSSGMNFLNAVPNAAGSKDCGYFWMSYYEGSIMTPVSYQVDVGADDHDNLMQYDYLNIRNPYSMIGEIIKTILTTKGITADKSVANVFTAQGYETLSAVSFIAPAPGCNVDIQIYRNGSPGEIAERTPDVTLNTEAVESAGFHTLDLGEKAINLRPNEAYTIVQTITSKNESYLPVELGSELEKNPSGGMTGAQAVCNPGESYVQTSEGWTDLSQIGEVTLKEQSKEMTFTVGNAMIKAYTNNREATAAELVMAQIDALGEIISLDQESQVVAARAAYDALPQREKAQVENIAVLEAAEAKIAALKAAQPQPEPQTSVQTVDTKGNATTGVTGVGTGLWVGAGLLAIMLIIGGCYAKKRMM